MEPIIETQIYSLMHTSNTLSSLHHLSVMINILKNCVHCIWLGCVWGRWNSIPNRRDNRNSLKGFSLCYTSLCTGNNLHAFFGCLLKFLFVMVTFYCINCQISTPKTTHNFLLMCSGATGRGGSWSRAIDICIVHATWLVLLLWTKIAFDW